MVLEMVLVATDIYAGHRGAQKGTTAFWGSPASYRPSVSAPPTLTASDTRTLIQNAASLQWGKHPIEQFALESKLSRWNSRSDVHGYRHVAFKGGTIVAETKAG
jgi:hypothetical protein